MLSKKYQDLIRDPNLDEETKAVSKDRKNVATNKQGKTFKINRKDKKFQQVQSDIKVIFQYYNNGKASKFQPAFIGS